MIHHVGNVKLLWKDSKDLPTFLGAPVPAGSIQETARERKGQSLTHRRDMGKFHQWVSWENNEGINFMDLPQITG